MYPCESVLVVGQSPAGSLGALSAATPPLAADRPSVPVPAAVGSAQFGLIAVLVASLLLSSGSTLVRKSQLPGSVMAFWRLVGGAIGWQVVLAVKRIPQTRAAWRRCLPAGVCFGCNIALFFTGLGRTRVANAEFIGTLTPLVVIPIAAWRLRERLPTVALGLGAVALAGVGVIVLSRGAGGAHDYSGDLLIVSSVAFWSTYLLVTRPARERVGMPVFMAVMSATAALTVLPIAASTRKIWPLPARAWPFIVVAALANGLLAHGLLVWAQGKVPVSVIPLIQLSQPGLSALWAYLFLQEGVTSLQIAGMVLVLAAVGAIVWTTSRPRTR